MTPGPVEANPIVLRAMPTNILGQFDPEFTRLMREIQEMLKLHFQIPNGYTLAVDGSSRTGLEARIYALIERGDKVLIPIYGRFAYLLAEIAQRAGAKVILYEKEWDAPFEQKDVTKKIKDVKPKLVAMIKGETASGQIQPVGEIGRYCQENDILFMLDTVAVFGGMPTKIEEWGVDLVVAGTQKCVSVPAGMAFIGWSERADKMIESRYQKELGLGDDSRNDHHILSNYLDLSQLKRYWSNALINYHTEATALVYGAHTGLRLLLEEELDNEYKRHAINEKALVEGIKAIGLDLYGNPTTKAITVNPLLVPKGIDANELKAFLLDQFGVEVAGTYGDLVGKVLRIGNMGYSSRRENILHVLGSLEATLIYYGAKINRGEAIQAALNVYLNA